MWNDNNNNNNIFNLPYHILWLLGVLSETQVWTGRVADLMLIPNMHYPATSEAEALPIHLLILPSNLFSLTLRKRVSWFVNQNNMCANIVDFHPGTSGLHFTACILQWRSPEAAADAGNRHLLHRCTWVDMVCSSDSQSMQVLLNKRTLCYLFKIIVIIIITLDGAEKYRLSILCLTEHPLLHP